MTGPYEQKLTSLAAASGDWDVPSAEPLRAQLETLGLLLKAAQEQHGLTGASGDAATLSLFETYEKAVALTQSIDVVSTTVAQANAVRRDAGVELENLPDGQLGPTAEAAVRGVATGVTILLGPISVVAGEGAVDAVNGWLSDRRERAAQDAVSRMTGSFPELPTIPDPESTAGSGESGVSATVPREPGSATSGGATTGGVTAAGAGAKTPLGTATPGATAGAATSSTGSTTAPTAPGSIIDHTAETGDGSWGSGSTLPGVTADGAVGGGSTTLGGGLGLGGSGAVGGSTSLGGLGGGSLGSSVLGAGLGAAAALGAGRIAALGGLGGGAGAGAGLAGGRPGISALGGAGGRGGLGAGGGAGATADAGRGGLLGGSTAGAGARAGTAGAVGGAAGAAAAEGSAGRGAANNMMGGAGAGAGAGGGSSSRKGGRGMGGPLAPKLDDEGDGTARSAAASAGGRTFGDEGEL
ncbi:hypothetical protein [Schumannella sp. 10F1B-5-1]|uniref:hypothetical protein n=1 Tax=Schumannella sp. 10F1B-5-1 TaxID=2590780 RepID=UPI0015E876D7|nr:hypothetical protein [Schumannella sp. 10F1B-5-1]